MTQSMHGNGRPQPEGVSVCIAAYNEAGTIGRLLDQLLLAADSGVVEVLVCANGCTDGTESLVAQFAYRDPRVRLILSSKGKPVAWNALMREARSDIRIFLDADIMLGRGFFPAIRDALHAHPDATIIAARALPRQVRAGPDAFLAALASRPFGFDYISGCAYAVRRDLLRQVLSEFVILTAEGTPQMPADVLPEDLWLEVAVGRSRIAFASAPRVYYDPGTVRDLLKTRARLRVAREQVAAMLPAAFRAWEEDTGRSRPLLARMNHRIGTMDGLGDALACVIGAVTRSMLTTLHRRQVMHLERTMLEQLALHGGQAVLAGSGRLSKGSRD